MKNLIAKAASILLAASLAAVCLTSCGDGDSSSAKDSKNKLDQAADFLDSLDGDDDDDSAESEAPKFKEESWGVYPRLIVPAGWEFRYGDGGSGRSPNAFALIMSENAKIEFRNETEKTQKDHLEEDKAANTDGQKDIPATKIGDYTWEGFSYNGGFEVITNNGSKFIRAYAVGLDFNSSEVQDILENLKVKE